MIETNSQYVGNIGDRISFKISYYEKTASWDNPYGITHLYTFIDLVGNVFTWKTSRFIEQDIQQVTGRVKDHSNYNGINETNLIYCKFN